MKGRRLGGTGLLVSELCFGTWEVGGARFGPVDAGEAVGLLRSALDQGVTTYDLSNLYGNGRSEVIVGAAFRHCREEVVYVSKAGYVTGSDGAQELLDESDEEALQCFEGPALLASCHESLKRLRTDYIDVFLLHDPSMVVLARQDVWETLRTLKRDGKVGWFGASTSAGPQAALRAIEMGAEVIEFCVHMFDSQSADRVVRQAQARGVGLLARSPFDMGRILARRELIEPLFRNELGRNLVEAAIQFPLSYEGASAVVVGMMNQRELNEDIAAFNARPLSPAELQAIARIVAANPEIPSDPFSPTGVPHGQAGSEIG